MKIFSKKYQKNGRSQAKKFTKPGKNSGNVGRMEEDLEEEIIQNFENIFFHFPKNIERMEETRQQNSLDKSKTLEMLEEWKKLWTKKKIN